MKTIKFILGIEHSVEVILSDFYSSIRRLETLAEQKLRFADKKNDVANAAAAARDAAVNEAIKAQQAATKIRDFLS